MTWFILSIYLMFLIANIVLGRWMEVIFGIFGGICVAVVVYISYILSKMD